MDERTRFRLVLLGSAGTLMIGGIVVWQYVKSVDEQTNAAYNYENTPVKFERKAPASSAGTQLATNVAGTKGVPAANNPGGIPSAKPGVPGQQTITSASPAATTSLSGAVPPARTTTSTVTTTTITSTKIDPATAARTNATTTPPAVNTNVVANKPPVSLPNQQTNGKNVIASAPAASASPAITSEAQVPPLDSKLPDVATKVPLTRYPAISRDEAKKAARLTAGKSNPNDFSELNFKPFPNNVQVASVPKALAATEKVLPPPPPKPSGGGSLVKRAGQLRDRLVPPPPPSPVLSGTAGVAGGVPEGLQLPIHQLPVPPERPSILDKFTVSAVIDDKVILTISSAVAMQNKWPKVLTMGPGDQFESVSVVAVSGDSVTLEEDGERTVKSVPSVR